jgi:peptidyl-prolyl cis-trans isomerase SurA
MQSLFIYLQSFEKLISINFMRNTAILLVASIFVTQFATAQKQSSTKAKPAVKSAAPVQVAKPNPWVFTFGPDTVYKEEFERLLSKNKKDKERPTEADVMEYLELYQNFKMKVKEAELLQLDTNSSFKTELAGYRKQLANPYLTDKKVTDGLIKEAYERMKTEVNASHILINCFENASPKDTLIAYNKILALRNRIVKGEVFDSVAAKNSDDPSAVKNYGNLGWFTSFQMIYPFETQAYTTAKGQVSMPFRTRFGYHILKVNDKRAARGEVKVQHIMLQTGPSAATDLVSEAKLKADSAYQKIMAGESFEKVVEQYSQDQGSKGNGGMMNYFSSYSNYPEKFKEIAFALQKDEVSKPFQTDYGYHILKLVDKKSVPDFKEVEENIKNKVGRDSRAESSKLVVAQRIKKENNYKEFAQNLKEFYATVDTTFLYATWIPSENNSKNNKPVMQLNDKVYTVANFADFAKVNQEQRPGESVAVLMGKLFKIYSDEEALKYEESMLEQKYPDFKNLMQEYHDGILLFDLTDKKVWSKAVNDTAGLEKFHEQNKQKYMWKERVKVLTYTCVDEKTKKAAFKMATAGKTPEEIKAKLNKKIAGAVVVSENKYEKSDVLGEKFWDKKGAIDASNEGSMYKFNVVEGIVPPEPKALKDARGIVTSDYQTYLEKEWIASMRAKYPVTVNQPVVNALFK